MFEEVSFGTNIQTAYENKTARIIRPTGAGFPAGPASRDYLNTETYSSYKPANKEHIANVRTNIRTTQDEVLILSDTRKDVTQKMALLPSRLRTRE